MHGPEGIIPIRGQVMVLRAAAPTAEITKTSWGANQGFEYWFPRPVKGDENPLIILGGGREMSGPNFETYVADDSAVNEDVGKALRGFLPSLFHDRYEKGREPEMEWASQISYFPNSYRLTISQTGIMGFTRLKDPFVLSSAAQVSHLFTHWLQVGPVVGPYKTDIDNFKGQYISAGYSGHGMPRAFAW